jgi:hypothetical protein
LAPDYAVMGPRFRRHRQHRQYFNEPRCVTCRLEIASDWGSYFPSRAITSNSTDLRSATATRARLSRNIEVWASTAYRMGP